MKRKANKWYYCRHCGKRYSDYAMADFCFKVDLRLLENEQKEKPIKKRHEKP